MEEYFYYHDRLGIHTSNHHIKIGIHLSEDIRQSILLRWETIRGADPGSDC